MSDFKTVLVRDSVLNDITSDIDFAVKSGASQTTYQRFPSTSNSNSAIIFSVQVPSENVVIGRDMLITSGITLQLTITNVTAGQQAFSYGKTDAFQAFPLNSLFTTASVQINNTTCSINTQDVLPSLLRMNDSRELYRFNSMTPALPDQAYGVYANGAVAGTNNNPLAGYENASYDLDQVPRGSFPAEITIRRYNAGGVFQDNSPISTNVTDQFRILVQTVVSEPLFLSPFIFGDPEYNCQGLLGINNMAFTLNIDSTCHRLWSTANAWTYAIQLGAPDYGISSGFSAPGAIGLIGTLPSAPALLFKFLSTQPSDLIETKNIVPYMDFPRYLTNAGNNPTIGGSGQAKLTSSNLQINQIPDLFIINVRKPMSTQTIKDPSSFLTITSISVNLNNQSGLLSSASAYDLWRMSVKNGSTQSWAEFSGQAQITDNATGAGTAIATTGSLLIINPAYDLSLPDYISCGSLGNYNFQFEVNVSNQYPDAIQPEVITICVNSGIFSTQQGVSAVYTGILTKEMVLSAKSTKSQSTMGSQEHARMIGGNMLNGALSSMRSMRKARLGRVMGGETSGGATSGGATSGGRMRKLC